MDYGETAGKQVSTAPCEEVAMTPARYVGVWSLISCHLDVLHLK